MIKENAGKYLYAAMAVGEAILEYGGEVSRVEDSVSRICKAYGFERVDVFCITSSMITTAHFNRIETCTQTCRITHIENDFERLGQVNNLSRSICSTLMDPDEVLSELKRIRGMERRSLSSNLLIYSLVPASFTVFFGGNALDMVISGLIGAVLFCLAGRIRKAKFNHLATALLCSLTGGLLAGVLALKTNAIHADLVRIGNVMVFIPGVKFTNSIRDLLTGETITGLISLAESLLLSVIVALGFAASSLMLM